MTRVGCAAQTRRVLLIDLRVSIVCDGLLLQIDVQRIDVKLRSKLCCCAYYPVLSTTVCPSSAERIQPLSDRYCDVSTCYTVFACTFAFVCY